MPESKISLIKPGQLFILIWLLGLMVGCTKLDKPLNVELLSQEIFQLTNAMRAEQKIPALFTSPSLDSLAHRQSQNMAEKNFFDHIDPDGNSPSDRMAKFLPQLLCSSSGENIALRSVEGDEAAMAKILTELWRKSPEHYQAIMNPDFRQLGIGIEQVGDKVWATQTFANAIAMLENPPVKVTAGTTVTLRFRFLAEFPSSELTAFFNAPDGTARIPVGNGTSYIGKGPIQPSWTDSWHFELTVPTRYGLGVYQIHLGHQSAYYDKVFQFEAVSAL